MQDARSQPNPAERHNTTEPSLTNWQIRTLVPRAQTGDQTALAGLFTAPRPWLVRACGSPHDGHHSCGTTEDVAQDACVRILRNLPGYVATGPDSFRSWLNVIVHRTMIDHHRACHHDRIIPVPQLPDHADPSDDSPADRAVIHDEHAHVRQVVARLSSVQQAVLGSRIIAGTPAPDVARQLGLTQAAVHATQHRALRRLRTLLNAAERGVLALPARPRRSFTPLSAAVFSTPSTPRPRHEATVSDAPTACPRCQATNTPSTGQTHCPWCGHDITTPPTETTFATGAA